MAWEGLFRVEKQLRETESYLDRQLLMQVQGQIDEAIYGTVNKKGDLLKAFTDY